jgi:hypothetical protein
MASFVRTRIRLLNLTKVGNMISENIRRESNCSNGGHYDSSYLWVDQVEVNRDVFCLVFPFAILTASVVAVSFVPVN